MLVPFVARERLIILHEILGARTTMLFITRLSRAFVFQEGPASLEGRKIFQNFKFTISLINSCFAPIFPRPYLTFLVLKSNFMQSLFLSFFQQGVKVFCQLQ